MDIHGKAPIVKFNMHNCGKEEIANLYSILSNLKEYLEKEYPLECMLSKLTTVTYDVKTTKTTDESDQKD